MTRTRLLGALVIVVVAAWWLGRDDDRPDRLDRHEDAPATRAATGLDRSFRMGGAMAGRKRTHADGAVEIGGQVYVADSRDAVAGAEVVFRAVDGSGESSATTGADGVYHLALPRGVYRTFVRDDRVLSIGNAGVERLPTDPSADAANAPDEATMAMVSALHDLDGVDLAVVLGGTVKGRVLDLAGRPVRDAVLRAISSEGVKPTLGTDVAETDEQGQFELRLPEGGYVVRATHGFYAGPAETTELEVEPGHTIERDITLIAGCVIAGRVVGAGGAPANEGAIERRGDPDFFVAGKIQSDGSFRFATTDEGDVTLRAWPWKSPSAAPQTFACRDGARFADVVFQVPTKHADLEGVLVDANGDRVPLAFVDIEPLDPGGMAQQERTDAVGAFGVFDLPPGRYRIKAFSPERGVAVAEVRAPQQGIEVALRGTGTLSGTTRIADGTFELELDDCDLEGASLALGNTRHLVTVTDHHFELAGVPACELSVQATWKTQTDSDVVEVPPGGTGTTTLDLGPRPAKHVAGIVYDPDGRPVEGATVVAVDPDDERVTTTTDRNGHYALDTFAGATVQVFHADAVAFAEVSTASGDHEAIDLRLRPFEVDDSSIEVDESSFEDIEE